MALRVVWIYMLRKALVTPLRGAVPEDEKSNYTAQRAREARASHDMINIVNMPRIRIFSFCPAQDTKDGQDT